jgi:hypothetical protein
MLTCVQEYQSVVRFFSRGVLTVFVGFTEPKLILNPKEAMVNSNKCEEHEKDFGSVKEIRVLVIMANM